MPKATGLAYVAQPTPSLRWNGATLEQLWQYHPTQIEWEPGDGPPWIIDHSNRPPNEWRDVPVFPPDRGEFDA